MIEQEDDHKKIVEEKYGLVYLMRGNPRVYFLPGRRLCICKYKDSPWRIQEANFKDSEVLGESDTLEEAVDKLKQLTTYLDNWGPLSLLIEEAHRKYELTGELVSGSLGWFKVIDIINCTTIEELAIKLPELKLSFQEWVEYMGDEDLSLEELAMFWDVDTNECIEEVNKTKTNMRREIEVIREWLIGEVDSLGEKEKLKSAMSCDELVRVIDNLEKEELRTTSRLLHQDRFIEYRNDIELRVTKPENIIAISRCRDYTMLNNVTGDMDELRPEPIEGFGLEGIEIIEQVPLRQETDEYLDKRRNDSMT